MLYAVISSRHALPCPVTSTGLALPRRKFRDTVDLIKLHPGRSLIKDCVGKFHQALQEMIGNGVHQSIAGLTW